MVSPASALVDDATLERERVGLRTFTFRALAVEVEEYMKVPLLAYDVPGVAHFITL
jgi:hypothetical protein